MFHRFFFKRADLVNGDEGAVCNKTLVNTNQPNFSVPLSGYYGSNKFPVARLLIATFYNCNVGSSIVFEGSVFGIPQKSVITKAFPDPVESYTIDYYDQVTSVTYIKNGDEGNDAAVSVRTSTSGCTPILTLSDVSSNCIVRMTKTFGEDIIAGIGTGIDPLKSDLSFGNFGNIERPYFCYIAPVFNPQTRTFYGPVRFDDHSPLCGRYWHIYVNGLDAGDVDVSIYQPKHIVL